MITDKQAIEAYNKIMEYCHDTARKACQKCIFCEVLKRDDSLCPICDASPQYRKELLEIPKKTRKKQ